MKTSIVTLIVLNTAYVLAPATPRLGANFSITAEAVDGGGRHATSASYTNDGSAGAVAGISTATSTTAKHGYIGQLYDVTGFAVTAHAAGMNESGSLQLEPVYVLDDATHLAIPPASVTWNVESGPITVTSDGIALADLVYQHTSATARGTLGGLTDLFEMTVYDGLPDNYGSYAGDGLDDSWQFQYFGLDNPLAEPLLDPDGDGQNNRFEWIAGLVPTDANSVFRLRILLSLEGANLIFGPTVAGRTYTVKYGFDFLDVPNWPTLTGGIVTDIGSQRTVTDPNAAASPQKFYRVEIEK